LTFLTIGGSTTECSFQGDNRAWPDLVAGHLNRSLRNVWLNNAGIAGHSTFGHIILLENYVIKLRPKVAVFLVGCNDVEILAPTPQYDDMIRHRKMLFSSVGAIASSLAQYSEAVACIYTVGRYVKIGSKAWRALDPEFRLLPPRYLSLSDTDIGRVKQAHRDIYLPGYRARLLKIAGLCRGSGIEPVFITQPYLFGEGKDERTGVDLALFETGPGSNGRMDWEVLEMYNDAVRALAEEQSVPVIDLARQMAKSSRYFFDDVHYTNEGVELVARLIYVELNEWLKRRFPEYAREPGSSGSDVTRTQPELRVR
jgi:lysophospholipase L1-like esterase